MPPASLIPVILIILVALAFDFANGRPDAANSIVTIVSTPALTPRQAGWGRAWRETGRFERESRG